MVVNGFDEYIDVKCKQCIKNVPIFYKVNGVKPHYIFDGRSFASHIIRKTSWIFGGQWKEIREEVSKYVTTFISKGASATFIIPHSPDPSVHSDLQNIKSGLEFAATYGRSPSSDFYQIPGSAYFVVAHTLMSSGAEVMCSLHDFEYEVAAWAKVKGASGIISNNNEFITMNGVPFFRLSSVDLTMGTADYIDRFILTKNLGIRINHLPVLSCMLGNSVFTPEMLERFHRKLRQGMQMTGKSYILDIMPRICMYVRPQNTQFSMLARTALQDETKARFLEEVVNRYSLSGVTSLWNPHKALQENLKIYKQQIYDAALSKHIDCRSVQFVYNVLTKYGYEEGLTIEYAPSTQTPAFDLYRPLRKLCYGIIVGGAATVAEKADFKQPVMVPAEEVVIKNKVINLGQLWGDNTGRYKWRAFVKCALVTFNETLARELPSQYLGLCCILNYWWHSPMVQLSEWELNAFLAQAVSQYASDVASLQRILVTVVSARAISLAALFARGAEVLLQIASVTGLPSAPLLPYNYFDGKLFSFYYYLSQNGKSVAELCDNLPDRLEMLNFLMMVIKSDNLSIGDGDDSDSDTKPISLPVTKSVSIVPAYEAISDDEDNGTEQISESEETSLYNQTELISDSEEMSSNGNPAKEVEMTDATAIGTKNTDKENCTDNTRPFPSFPDMAVAAESRDIPTTVTVFMSAVASNEHGNKRRKSEES